MKRKGSPIPPCPHCDDNTGECQHVLVNYDRSMGTYMSGYIAKSNPETRKLEAEIIDLIIQKIQPDLNDVDYEIISIWEDAVDSYDPEDGSFFLDSTPYLSLLESTEDEYDTISFRYSDDNYEADEEGEDIPGYSSAGIIFYSEDPPKSLETFNNMIIENLKLSSK